MDELLVTNAARKLFTLRGILPSTWAIPSDEKTRLSQSPIGIAIFNSPASVLNLDISPIPPRVRFLIVIDGGPLHAETITPQEQIGVLLHEFGHHVNPPPKPTDDAALIASWGRLASGSNHLSEDELFADDYARHCGFGFHFANAMEKMKNIGVPGFDHPSIDERIGLLRTTSEPRLNLAPLNEES